MVLYKLFYFGFCALSDQGKKAVYQRSYKEFERHFYSYKFAFILVLAFRRNQKQESRFQQVGGLETTNIFCFLFIASRTLLQRYTEFNKLL